VICWKVDLEINETKILNGQHLTLVTPMMAISSTMVSRRSGGLDYALCLERKSGAFQRVEYK
jgi:hypothetical protein